MRRRYFKIQIFRRFYNAWQALDWLRGLAWALEPGGEPLGTVVVFLLFPYPTYLPWHCLYFLPEPQGQGSLRPTTVSLR